MFYKAAWRHDLSALVGCGLADRREYTESQKYGLAQREATPSPLVTHTIIGPARDYALSLLPTSLLALETPQVMQLSMDAVDAPNPSLTAHVDYNRRCALNAYIQTNGETNHFYRWDRQAKELIPVGEFVASDGEWWLLDTSIPHSVALKPKHKRVVVSYSFEKTPFDKVERAIKECL